MLEESDLGDIMASFEEKSKRSHKKSKEESSNFNDTFDDDGFDDNFEEFDDGLEFDMTS